MNWPSYNQSLVRRGQILLGFDVINNWDTELKEMNKDKVGEPFHYPNTFLLSLGRCQSIFSSAILTNQRRNNTSSCQRESTLYSQLYYKTEE
ncbi:MAG: hypothetical protein ACTHKK_11730 [Candidatus Nitrosocosmicus sp.]